MAISGHKTEKAFRKYIKADNLEKAQMIRKLWGGRRSDSGADHGKFYG